MTLRFHAAVICVTVLVTPLVTGCDKTPSQAPLPTTNPLPAQPGPTTGVGTDASVPAAASVLEPATASETADPASAGRSGSALSDAQESTAMPMPGQNNDHSAPAAADKRASSP